LEEATCRYLETVTYTKSSRENTKKSEAYAMKALLRVFSSDKRLEAIQASEIATWRDQMIASGLSHATVNRYLALLRAVLNRAHSEWNALQFVPRFKLLPLTNNRCRFLSEEEEERILEVSPPHLKSLVIILIDTGARLSEALDVTWSDVDLRSDRRSSITLQRTKNGMPRRIPLTLRSHSLLMGMRIDSDDLHQPVFLYRASKNAEAVPYRKPFGSWKTALRRAKVDQTFRMHDLRHTFASRLVSRGVPVFDVSKLLGHKSISMTMRYAHLAPEAYESAIERLEKDDLTDVIPQNAGLSGDLINLKEARLKRRK
jgi:integrase